MDDQNQTNSDDSAEQAAPAADGSQQADELVEVQTDDSPADTSDGQAVSDEKLLIKQEAVDALLPLMDQIDESAQRKFEIFITAARSADNPKILKKALDVALTIESPSDKTEALMDVINEASLPSS